jgi:hypothetical protein
MYDFTVFAYGSGRLRLFLRPEKLTNVTAGLSLYDFISKLNLPCLPKKNQ